MMYFTQSRTLLVLISSLGVLIACSSREQTPYSRPADIEVSRHASELAVSRSRQASPMLAKAADFIEINSVGLAQLQPIDAPTETYEHYPINDTLLTRSQRVSTFSIDVDTGAYSNMRRFIQHGSLPPADAIRIEELVNYFNYGYASDSTPEKPFSINTEIATTPWNDKTHLLRIGLSGYTPHTNEEPAANLVFLLDVSGSMDSPDKLGLVKSSIGMMSKQLDENDSISIVVYAGSSGTVLEPTPGDEHKKILQALSRLTAGGSTNGQQGIELAYQLATENFVDGGVNRVILATDGDFNVGTSDVASLKKLIARKRDSGIALTTLGFGSGNYNDHLMEQIAQEGNGNYAYIDTLAEARKVLVDELNASLINIAKDVKIQVEFNPDTVSEYRLIGYTNRKLANEDFDNDNVDAGEIGAGHTVTAIYEIALAGSGGEKHTATRYQSNSTSPSRQKLGELAEVRLRYKLPDEERSRLISRVVRSNEVINQFENSSVDFRFAVSVAALGQHLQDNKNMNKLSLGDIHEMASASLGSDTFGYRKEFLNLVDMADTLDRIERASLEPMKEPKDRG